MIRPTIVYPIPQLVFIGFADDEDLPGDENTPTVVICWPEDTAKMMQQTFMWLNPADSEINVAALADPKFAESGPDYLDWLVFFNCDREGVAHKLIVEVELERYSDDSIRFFQEYEKSGLIRVLLGVSNETEVLGYGLTWCGMVDSFEFLEEGMPEWIKQEAIANGAAPDGSDFL